MVRLINRFLFEFSIIPHTISCRLGKWKVILGGLQGFEQRRTETQMLHRAKLLKLKGCKLNLTGEGIN